MVFNPISCLSKEKKTVGCKIKKKKMKLLHFYDAIYLIFFWHSRLSEQFITG